MPVLLNEYQVRKQIIDLISTNSSATLKLESNRLLNLALSSKQPELRSQVVGIMLYMKSDSDALKLAKISSVRFPESFDLIDAVAKIYEASPSRKLAIPFRKKTIALDPLNRELVQLLIENQKSL